MNNTLLNDEWVTDEIREEIKKFLKLNENENTTYQNLWNTANTILRGKVIPMNAFIRNTERSQIKYIILHPKLLEKQEQAKPKTKRKETIKIRAKIYKIETKKKNHTKNQ
jgi:hypothetical protein